MFDFTYEKYESLCKALAETGYRSVTMREYFAGDRPEKMVLLRHDIDNNIWPAVEVAEAEHRHGLRSTHYVRYQQRILQPRALSQIAGMGHEIGYHYETLDKARGDFGEAIRRFEEELRVLRQHYNIDTIAMHGNPLSKLNNRDLWTKYDFRNFGLLGEAYLSVDFDAVHYFSDSGRSWDDRFKIHDTIVSNRPRLTVRNTDELISLIRSGKVDQLYLLTHPNIWTRNLPFWYRELIRLNVIKGGKLLIRMARKPASASRSAASGSGETVRHTAARR